MKGVVHFDWWVKPYLWCCACGAMVRQREPDVEQVWRRVAKGVRVVPS